MGLTLIVTISQPGKGYVTAGSVDNEVRCVLSNSSIVSSQKVDQVLERGEGNSMY
jgi:hypothetical protein